MHELNTVSTFGGVGLIVVLLSIMGRLWWRAERARGDDEKRHSAEITRINRDRDADVDELREEIKTLRQRVDDLEKARDEERRLRRDAEDRLWKAVRDHGPRES